MRACICSRLLTPLAPPLSHTHSHYLLPVNAPPTHPLTATPTHPLNTTRRAGRLCGATRGRPRGDDDAQRRRRRAEREQGVRCGVRCCGAVVAAWAGGSAAGSVWHRQGGALELWAAGLRTVVAGAGAPHTLPSDLHPPTHLGLLITLLLLLAGWLAGCAGGDRGAHQARAHRHCGALPDRALAGRCGVGSVSVWGGGAALGARRAGIWMFWLFK